MPKWTHVYDVILAFEVTGSSDEEGKDVTGQQLWAAAEARLSNLSDKDMLEECDEPWESYKKEDNA